MMNMSAAQQRKPGRNATTYYVSSREGSDANSGLSPQSALRSLQAVSRKPLAPGDSILLERGSLFENDYLHLYDLRATADNPIRISAYGKGAQPEIRTNGQGRWYQDYGVPLDNPAHKNAGYVSSAVLLYDCAGIEISDLSITNGGEEQDSAYNDLNRMDRTGVAVVAQNGGTLSHIYLSNLTVCHVHGNVYNKHMNNGGIYFTAFMPADEEKTGIARFDDVCVERCYLEDVNRWGIAVAYTAYCGHFLTKEIPDEVVARYGASRVVIRRNFVKDAGGDSITTMYCDRPLIEQNVSDGAGRQINKRDYAESDFGRVAAAVWPWKCKNALFQFNEVFNTRYHNGENQDGQAFDADWGDGTIYQYNYSHDNEGGCLMVCGEEAVNTIFRYNISQNDGRAILLPASSPVAQVYNNTFYIKEGVPFIDTNSDDVGPMVLKNNLVYYAGNQPRQENWYTDVTEYSNNLFWGYQNAPENGQNNLTADPCMQAPGTGKTGTTLGPALDTLAGYRLQKSSPAIGAGVATGPQLLDFYGNTVPNPPSIGAYQTPAE